MDSLKLKVRLKTTLLVALFAPVIWAAETGSIERHQKRVDRAALLSQDQAIASLEKLAKKQEGGEREYRFLSKLVEAHQIAAKIEFRLSHSGIQDDGSTKEVPAEYQRRQKNVISAASNLIQKYPQEEGVESAFYARAEANGELRNKSEAEKDFDQVATKFPFSSWAERANLALGALAVEAGDYLKAIGFLKKVEALRSEQYPFVLHQIAWAHFNLNDIPSAISYLKRRNEFYAFKGSLSAEGKLSVSDLALQEQGLRDLAAFYFSAYDKGDPKFPLPDALAMFRRVKAGTYLGKMLVQFASSLKSRDRVEGLEQWVKLIVDEEAGIPEAIDVVCILLEYASEKNMFERGTVFYLTNLDKATHQQARNLPGFSKALNYVLQGAAGLQQTMSKEKAAEKVASVRKALLEAYESFLVLAGDSHPALAGVHFNRAELYFTEENFVGASAEYRWLVESGPGNLPYKPFDFSHKAIVSDFRALLKLKVIPKDLELGKLQGESSPDLKALPSPARDWVVAVATHVEKFGRNPDGFVEFEFEAYRLLYSAGQTRAALAGIRKMVRERHSANVAMPAAKIALDTYINNGDWKSSREFAAELKKTPSLGNEAFQKRVANLPAEIQLHAVEEAIQAGDRQAATVLAQEFMRLYSNSPLAPQAMLLSSQILLGNHDVRGARQQLTQLINRFQAADNLSSALLLRGGLAESEFDFDSAAEDLQRALILLPTDASEAERLALARRSFLATWLSSNPKALDCTPFAQFESMAQECDRYRGLVAMAVENAGVSQKEAAKSALGGYEGNRAIWSAVALKMGAGELEIKERLALASGLAARWKTQDPLIQVVLIATLNRVIPEAFRVSQKTLPQLAPLKADSKSLVKRIGLIKEVETRAEQIIDLPWAHVRVSLLSTIAQIYSEFCEELAKLPRPKNLSAADRTQYDASVAEILNPFRAKQEAISAQVKAMAAQSAVDPEALSGSAARALATEVSDRDLMKSLLDELRPLRKPNESPGAGEKLANLWEEAIKLGAWGRAAFFFQELKEKQKVKAANLTALRALSFARAGAKAEAVTEIEAVIGQLEGNQNRFAVTLLAGWYQNSTAPEKANAPASAPETRRAKP